jgi:hypothetical protein
MFSIVEINKTIAGKTIRKTKLNKSSSDFRLAYAAINISTPGRLLSARTNRTHTVLGIRHHPGLSTHYFFSNAKA